MLAAKHREWVLQTIDRLRQRKARPDLERISRMVERFHGLTFSETQDSLEKLVQKGVIMKVHFKGNISYRRCMKQFEESDEVAFSTGTRIVHALKCIMKQTGDGVSFEDLEKWLLAKNPDTRLVKERLELALERQLQSNVITKLPDDCYVLTQSLPKQMRKMTETQPLYPSVSKSNTNLSDSTNTTIIEKKSDDTKTNTSGISNDHVEDPVILKKEPEEEIVDKVKVEESIPHQEARRGRPPSKRKKFKKTHGPDFETTVEIKKSSSEASGDVRKSKEKEKDVCAFCSVSDKFDKNKDVEPLLTCKECNVHAHPSCMDYSEELAHRALNSPWQCMECKTCCVCDGSDNAEVLLFCDACDKGYHMSCHEPPLNKQPKGKWVCTSCKQEVLRTQEQKGRKSLKSDRTNESLKEDEQEITDKRRRGRKRGLSQQVSVEEIKRHKSFQSSSHHDSLSNSAIDDKIFEDFTDGTAGASCLPTPSASPRHGDTFDYEMKMSMAGHQFLLPDDDETEYSDATEWTIDQVVSFFEGCGFKDQAYVFKEQEIDGRSLLLMQRNDVLTGLALKLGPALKIFQKILKLQLHSQAHS